MFEIITGEEVLKKYGITLKELFQFMRKGLPATSQAGDEVYNIDDFTAGPSQDERIQATRRYTIRQMQKQRGQPHKEDVSEFPTGWYGISTELPKSKAKQEQAIKQVEGFLFSEANLLRYVDWPESVTLKPTNFPGIDTNTLKNIAEQWAADYAEKNAIIRCISLHPVAMPIPLAEHLPSGARPKFAVVFHCPDCKREDLPTASESAKEHFYKVTNNKYSPYTDLWCDFQNKPDYLFYRGLFESAYHVVPPPEKWTAEWRFILKYSGESIPLDVITDTGVILYRDGHSGKSTPTITWAPGGDFPKDRMTRQKEFSVWHHWIKPIIDKHFNGKIEYKYFKEPEVIRPEDIEVILRRMITPFVFEYNHGPFPTDDFLKEVVDSLRAGFEEYEGVDLKNWFNDFLRWTMDGGHLPTFLAYIEHERSEHPIPEIMQSSSQNGTVKAPSDVKTEEPEIFINTEQTMLEVKKKKERSLNSDFQKVMDQFTADVCLFWDSLKRKTKNRHGSMNSAEGKALYDLAKEVYQEHETNFQKLEIEDIDNKDFYAKNTDRKRAIIGNVLLQVIGRKCPQALTCIEIDTSIESLHNLFRSKQPFKKSKSR